jgi:hypothetical protein
VTHINSLLKKNKATNEIHKIMAKASQYVFTVKFAVKLGICTEKILVIRLTGRNRTLSLARRVAARVRRAEASESFWALILKYYCLLVGLLKPGSKECYCGYKSVFFFQKFLGFTQDQKLYPVSQSLESLTC